MDGTVIVDDTAIKALQNSIVDLRRQMATLEQSVLFLSATSSSRHEAISDKLDTITKALREHRSDPHNPPMYSQRVSNHPSQTRATSETPNLYSAVTNNNNASLQSQRYGIEDISDERPGYIARESDSQEYTSPSAELHSQKPDPSSLLPIGRARVSFEPMICYQSITRQTKYANLSFEELRLADYRRGYRIINTFGFFD